ncbi:hypothetical protein AB1Y20_020821 [Prymnesium parvum]|uniref:Uncharacterized protein n=1 Tax=Prymnesium parvum TaxID=97485 RepID=A0AB34JY19_PRYPA
MSEPPALSAAGIAWVERGLGAPVRPALEQLLEAALRVQPDQFEPFALDYLRLAFPRDAREASAAHIGAYRPRADVAASQAELVRYLHEVKAKAVLESLAYLAMLYQPRRWVIFAINFLCGVLPEAAHSGLSGGVASNGDIREEEVGRGEVQGARGEEPEGGDGDVLLGLLHSDLIGGFKASDGDIREEEVDRGVQGARGEEAEGADDGVLPRLLSDIGGFEASDGDIREEEAGRGVQGARGEETEGGDDGVLPGWLHSELVGGAVASDGDIKKKNHEH